jgi:protein-disulfide isomerase
VKTQSELDNRSAAWSWLLVIILVIQTAVLFLSALQLRTMSAIVQATLVQVGAGAPAAVLDDGGGPTTGPAGAAVTVVYSSDFQCADCVVAAPVMKSVMAGYQDRVRFVYRHFPLGPAARQAAIAAECAHRQDRFWEMHDLLLANHDKITPIDLETYAAQIGLDPQPFAECLVDSSASTTIEQDVADGEQYGVIVPPVVFINGRPFLGELTFEELQRRLEAELAAIKALEELIGK